MKKHTLSNGAVELMRKGTDESFIDIVLALFRDEYVTWVHNKETDGYSHGHYHGRDLEKATKDFNERK